VPTAASTLVTRVRRRIRDFPDIDSLSTSVGSGGSTVTVTGDASLYRQRQRIDIDSETLLVTGAATGQNVPVRRGTYGSVAASHSAGAIVLVDPKFTTVEILDAINAGLENLWPHFYRQVSDTTSIVPDGTTYEYAVPTVADLGGIPMPAVYRIEWRWADGQPFENFSLWDIRRTGSSPKIAFKVPPPTGMTIRVQGYAPFPKLSSLSAELDAQFPYDAEDLLVLYAANTLLASGESGRVRSDAGAVDSREEANRVGASLNASRDWRQQFYLARSERAMPPITRHIVV
jgi:hypothetical protein